jgi:hypothetical protein
MKILQIIPADGWYATYVKIGEGREEEPLACWALVEDGAYTQVVGMISDGDVIEVANSDDLFGGDFSFFGYEYKP